MESHELTKRFADGLADPSAGPVALQIVENIWLAVVDGTLETGERLPTVRQLAIALGVTPRAVERAYRQLQERGVVSTRPGEGTFVALVPASAEEQARHREFAALCREAVQRAHGLGYGVDELIDALTDYRAEEQRR
jgi:DNA-binding transcriptional regulator YhcF (GntR family)